MPHYRFITRSLRRWGRCHQRNMGSGMYRLRNRYMDFWRKRKVFAGYGLFRQGSWNLYDQRWEQGCHQNRLVGWREGLRIYRFRRQSEAHSNRWVITGLWPYKEIIQWYLTLYRGRLALSLLQFPCEINRNPLRTVNQNEYISHVRRIPQVFIYPPERSEHFGRCKGW